MRRILLVILGFGVISGFGSAFAHARYMRHHGGCDGGGGDRWGQRWERPSPVAAPVQTVVVPQAAPAPVQMPAPYAAPAPQIFVITVPSGGSQPVAPVVVTTPATAPAAAQ